MKSLFVILMVLMPVFAKAEPVLGNLRGNGGFLIHCQNSPVLTLDYYEAQVNLGLKIRPFEPSVGTEFTKVNLFLQKLIGYDPELAQTLSKWLSTFYDEIEWSSFAEENMTHDLGINLASKSVHDCRLQQLVIQWSSSESLPWQGRYQVNESLWRQLEVDQRVVLILHELIYRYVLENRNYTVNSTAVRSFVSGTLLAIQTDVPPTIFEFQFAKRAFLFSPL